MKKILFVIYSLDSGGVSSSLSCLYDYLKTKDCEIRVFPLASEGCNATSFRDVTMHGCSMLTSYYRMKPPKGAISLLEYFLIKGFKKIGKRLSFFDIRRLLYFFARRKILKEFSPDMVIAYQEGDNAKFVSSFCGVKKIAWIHFDYAHAIPKETDESAIFSKFDNIVCVSKYTAGTFANRYPNLKNRIRYIYNLLDEERILRLSQEKEIDESFTTDLFTIISAGRISPEKGFSTIPAIAKSLKDHGCIFRWYIIGREDKPKELIKLREEIETNNVSGSVIWLGAKNNPYPYFKSSNLYVSTSYSEACPMVFNEARVLGIPIVSTDFGSSYEFINNGIDGFIVSRDELPMVLQKMIKDENIYQKMKQGAKSFSLDDTMLYKQIDELLLLN